MKIYSVYDSEFKPYGKVLDGYNTACLVNAMNTIPLPESGTAYEPSIPALEATCTYGQLQNNAFGGMPIQLGMCWGRNTKLNCLEYHRDSEVNVGASDFILLLAKQDEIVDGMLDTAVVKAFKIPASVLVEVYATSLHYAPCQTAKDGDFRVAVVLPRGTNTNPPGAKALNEEDTWLTARNKWLLAHPEAPEAAQGAHIGLKGVNIDIAADI